MSVYSAEISSRLGFEMDTKFYDISEIITILEVFELSNTTVWRYIKTGEIGGGIKIGRKYRVPEKELIAYLDRKSATLTQGRYYALVYTPGADLPHVELMETSSSVPSHAPKSVFTED